MVWRPNDLSLYRWIYRALLLAYPAEFRREYGGEMEALFVDRFGRESQWRLWLEAVTDVAVAAPREHLHILSDDIRHGARVFAKSPGFTAVALLVIALGIGATTTVFSLIDAVLLRSLPYGHPERLVYMWRPLTRIKDLPLELTPPYADVMAWRRMNRSFRDITAVEQGQYALNDGETVRVSGARVLGNFFQTLDAAPQLGRAIDASDDESAQLGVVVISDALWRSRFDSTADVLGKLMRIDRKSYRVIGVMPKEFAYPHGNEFPGAPYTTLKRTEFWIPRIVSPRQQSDRMDVGPDPSAVIARLRPGVSLQQAQSEMSAIQKQLEPLYPADYAALGIQSIVAPFVETAVGPVRPLLRLLMAAVFLILLMACCNLANLLLARAVARIHEMGVRTALGAERARLVRLMLTESLMLWATGGALGALLTFGALKMLAKLNPGDIPRFEEAVLDSRVLLFGLLISLGTGLVSGIFPALSASFVNVGELLRHGGRGIAGVSWRARNVLIVTQVALAVVLLASAGLLIRSYLKVQGQDKGFAPSTLTMELITPSGGQGDQPAQTPGQKALCHKQESVLFRDVMRSIRVVPGVQAAGAVGDLPLSHSETALALEVDGYANQPNQIVDSRQTAGEYFQSMQIRLIAGRFLHDGDLAAKIAEIPEELPPAVVVSESFARLYFPGRDAIGHRLRFEQRFPWSTIVGVVADVRHTSLEQAPKPTVYSQSRSAGMLAIRTAVPPNTIIPAIRKALNNINGGIELANIQTMDRYIADANSLRRFQTVVLTAFAGVAVFLSLVGLYGLLSYAVRQRTAEIGVRMALGAGRVQVLGMMVRYGLTLTAAGLAVGLALAFALTRGMASLLYGVNYADPITFIAVPAFILAVAMVACLVPGWKAARINPVDALRCQ